MSSVVANGINVIFHKNRSTALCIKEVEVDDDDIMRSYCCPDILFRHF